MFIYKTIYVYNYKCKYIYNYIYIQQYVPI